MWIRQFFVALVYLLVATIALEFAVVEGNATLIWPSSGVALAVLIRFGAKYAVGIFFGAFLSGIYAGNEPIIWWFCALGNTLEPLLALYLLRFLPFSKNVYHNHDYLSLIFAGSVGAIASALLGSVALFLVNYITVEQIPKVIFHWWMADALGMFSIGPFLLLFSYSRIKYLLQERALEVLLILISGSSFALIFYAGWGELEFNKASSNYLLMIPLVWAILRFGQVISAIVIAQYFCIAIYGLLFQKGMFWEGDLQTNLYFFWGHFSVISILTMLVAYAISERHTFSQAVRNSKTETYIFCEDDIHFEFINQSALNNQGLSLFSALKLTPVDIQLFTSETELFEKLQPLRDGKLSFVAFETVVQRRDKSFYPVEVNIQMLDYSSRESYLISLVDITEHLEKEKHLILGNSVCELSSQAIMITDANVNIIRVNHAFTKITGYKEEDALGKNPSFLSSGRHEQEFYQALWASLIEDGMWTGEIYNRRKSGELYLQSITIKALSNSVGDVENYIAMFIDITQEREQTLQLKHLSEHDVLTGLPNKSLLQKEFLYALAVAKRQSTQLGLLFIDLNNFKPINDKYGHTFGDNMLQAIAIRMQSCIRETDIVSRVGGDEFVVLVSNTESDKNCAILTEKLKNIISQVILIEHVPLQVSASIGVANYPEQGDSLEALLSVADKAMYEDKKVMKSSH